MLICESNTFLQSYWIIFRLRTYIPRKYWFFYFI